MELKKSIKWICFWVGMAAIVNLIILITLGKELALEFTAGYLIELSLSIDNLFVFVRMFMFPKKFALMTGFPQKALQENGSVMRNECPERQFIVHVEELDE